MKFSGICKRITFRLSDSIYQNLFSQPMTTLLSHYHSPLHSRETESSFTPKNSLFSQTGHNSIQNNIVNISHFQIITFFSTSTHFQSFHYVDSGLLFTGNVIYLSLDVFGVTWDRDISSENIPIPS